jgi:hypothetical protein
VPPQLCAHSSRPAVSRRLRNVLELVLVDERSAWSGEQQMKGLSSGDRLLARGRGRAPINAVEEPRGRSACRLVASRALAFTIRTHS